MRLPMSSPRPMMKTAKRRKVWRTVLLRAPSAFMMPIMLVRSRMMMSSPLIIVKPATATIRARIIHTLRLRRSSHAKMLGTLSMMVSELYVEP